MVWTFEINYHYFSNIDPEKFFTGDDDTAGTNLDIKMFEDNELSAMNDGIKLDKGGKDTALDIY